MDLADRRGAAAGPKAQKPVPGDKARGNEGPRLRELQNEAPLSSIRAQSSDAKRFSVRAGRRDAGKKRENRVREGRLLETRPLVVDARGA
jgi:hypothetical protein